MAKKKKAKKAKKTTKKRTIKVESFVMKSKIKEFISAKGMNSSSDVFAAINFGIQFELDQAVKRAQLNKRKTVRGHDLLAI